MATADTGRRSPGRPEFVETLTPFGEALRPQLKRLKWTIYRLGAEINEEPSTIWRWMKTAKKWPPSDKTDAISKAVGVRLTAPPARRKAR